MITAEERAAMQASVRRAVGDAVATAGEGADVDAALTELGWLEMLEGAEGDAVDIVFNALGAANATATALDDVIAAALGAKPRTDLAIVLPRYATWDPPGRLDGEQVQGHGVASSRATNAAELLVVSGTESEPQLATVPASAAEVATVHGVDPSAGLCGVRVRGAATRTTRLDPLVWQTALALGRRAVAHQIAGASRAMLDLARTHALERTQFGRPIARFQAVRHRLAEVLVAVEGLEAALDAARQEPTPQTAALAKAIAGRTASTTARHCQQVLAGIGFTTEHRFHHFMKRTVALEGLFGSAEAIVLDVGRRVLATRRVPTLIEL